MSYSKAIDSKWQEKWKKLNLADFDESRIENKLYILEMFSYPSGDKLHIGHWYNYGLSDSWARMKKMQGYEIFQPMGFDAFGLPAENHAIKTGEHPFDVTMRNIDTMKKQLSEMGNLFNWRHSLQTCTPDYYRWNQWLFLKLYEQGLAYRKNAQVNWCPSCQTVLANEQVLADGNCERCDSLVTRKDLTQWFFKITDYAEELLADLDQLDWPETTKKKQINWIGKSKGAEICFEVEKDNKLIADLKLKVFTTRADTLMGATYLVIAPENPVLEKLITKEQEKSVLAYQEQARLANEIDRLASNREKTGVFTGSYALHPLSQEKLEIWTADYVLAHYGTGTVMAVPAHDERDYEFAQKFKLPILEVIESNSSELPYCEYGTCINSGKYNGLSSSEAIDSIIADLAKLEMGCSKINYRLHDWLVSRQRYWGTPIPMIHCDDCGIVPVPESQLPLELPYNVEFTPDGKSPLAKAEQYMSCTCPSCGKAAQRDPDTLDTFVCSSWYQFRYVDNCNEKEIFSRERVNQLCPVDKYVGGQEHAVMHLLYARFITKALRDMGYLDFDEPFLSLVHQGVILGPDGQKMSKSLGNTISPDQYIELYGSDVLRLYLAFNFSYVDGGPWSDNTILAMKKFIQRVERLVEFTLNLEAQAQDQDEKLNYSLHYAISEMTRDAEKFQFNTAISRIMELLNSLQACQKANYNQEQFQDAVSKLICLLAPFAPHFCEEMWEKLGHKTSIFLEKWPVHDPQALILDEIEIAIQVNGSLKAKIMIPSSAQPQEVQSLIEALPNYAELLAGKQLVKFIYVPKRLANLVIK